MFKSFLVVLFVFFSLFIISKTNYADEPSVSLSRNKV